MTDNLIIACPTCKKSLKWKDCGENRPFCSKRCKLIDLGDWANENHTIAGASVNPDDENSQDF